MPSKPSKQDQIEAQATAFVFGELDPDEATQFMKQLDSSTKLQELVASIRETAAAIELEFDQSASGVNVNDRLRIESAIKASAPQPPPVSVHVSEGATRNWTIGLAVAATLLLVSGLTIPTLNKVITANNGSETLKEKIRLVEAENERLSQQIKQQRAELEFVNRSSKDQMATLPSNDSSEIRRSATADEQRSASAQPGSGDPQDGGPAIVAATTTDSPANSVPADSITTETRQPVSDTVRDPSESPALALGMDTDASPGGPKSGQDEKDDQAALTYRGESLGGDGPSMLAQPIPSPAGTDSRQGKVNQFNLDLIDPTDGSMEKAGEILAEREGMGMGLAAGGRGGMAMGMTGGAMDGMMGDGDPFGPVHDGYRRSYPGLDDMFAAQPHAGDRFGALEDNAFETVGEKPLSTFSIDVDTASYSKVRMYLNQHNMMPPADAVRIEELINYFSYGYDPPRDERPFSAKMEIAGCPWNPNHRLARIGIKGRVIEHQRPATNLVFLIDVSGSMTPANKLPLVIDGMNLLIDRLGENDSVAIVVYAGAAGLVLESTSGDRKSDIKNALNRLRAGGSTNGGQGIQLAYHLARENFIVGGTNRVILCSDGDFNVGVTDKKQLVKLVAENAKSNVFLSVLGFGMGNHNDEMMEKISNDGNGNYAFIDNLREAKKVLVEQLEGTLTTIAKDVKVQVEFNPAEVQSYRLIGYANRMLAANDFNDDSKDAGEIGAGHAVTAFYEIIPVKSQRDDDDPTKRQVVDELRYQRKIQLSEAAKTGELLTLKLRYKLPTGDTSTLMQFPISDDGKRFNQADEDFQFAASVAAFGMLLRNSPYRGNADYDMVEEIARSGAKPDPAGYRDEFVSLVRRARRISGG